jgi:hypothetical protein
MLGRVHTPHAIDASGECHAKSPRQDLILLMVSASSSQATSGGDAVILHCKMALDNRYMSAFLTNR